MFPFRFHLFIIFYQSRSSTEKYIVIYDLPQRGYLVQCKYHCFTYDTIIYLKGNNVNELINVINSELDELNYWWFAVNKFKLNIEKTEMFISSDNESRHAMASVLSINETVEAHGETE